MQLHVRARRPKHIPRNVLSSDWPVCIVRTSSAYNVLGGLAESEPGSGHNSLYRDAELDNEALRSPTRWMTAVS